MTDSLWCELTSDLLLDDAVYLEVWISTDRRGEVRIVLECETKVAKRSIRVGCLCHLREKESAVAIELGGIRYILEELSDMSRLEDRSRLGSGEEELSSCTVLEDRSPCTIAEYTLDNLGLLITRQSVNPREKRETMMLTPLRHFFIREYHEFFDELVSIITLSSLDIYWSFLYSDLRTILEVKIYLRRFKRDFAFFSSTLLENMVEGGCYFY